MQKVQYLIGNLKAAPVRAAPRGFRWLIRVVDLVSGLLRLRAFGNSYGSRSTQPDNRMRAGGTTSAPNKKRWKRNADGKASQNA